MKTYNKKCTYTRHATIPCEGCDRGHHFRKGHGPKKESHGRKVGTRCALVMGLWLCEDCKSLMDLPNYSL